jgi:hypothetical protein
MLPVRTPSVERFFRNARLFRDTVDNAGRNLKMLLKENNAEFSTANLFKLWRY